jgi:pyruvate dehydrogenase E1 component
LDQYGVAADVWSVTSYKQLYRDGEATDRWNMLHPGRKRKLPYLSECLAGAAGPIVAATDYVKALPESVSRWCPRPFIALGTDGFGRSEGRAGLREFFEVNSRFIALATLHALAREGKIAAQVVTKAMKDLEIDPEKADPATA